MDIEVVKKIEYCSKQIIDLLGFLDKAGQLKAEAERDYDRELSKAIAELDASAARTTLVPGIAKGMVADHKYNLVLAETAYKSLLTKIEAQRAVMNAQQSIFRHLDTGI